MKQGRIFAFAAACALGLGVSTALAETAWDMSVVWPEGNFHTQNALAFAEAVKEATEGEVVITVHSGGALGIKGPEGMAARSASRGRRAWPPCATGWCRSRTSC